eukprot:Sspe_Gene.59996::Locus_33013_Transcript_1_1_Confidence_1.000_Length_1301::g.59996::m.59996/K14731/mlhB, chnC; epsilon-lactone hydrolase
MAPGLWFAAGLATGVSMLYAGYRVLTRKAIMTTFLEVMMAVRKYQVSGKRPGEGRLWWVHGPSPSPEYLAFDALFRSNQQKVPAPLSPETLRKEMCVLPAILGHTRHAREVLLGGVRCLDVIYPGVDEGAKVVLYAHGGGYVAGSPDMYGGFLDVLSRLTGRRVVALDYRLAPENTIPDAVDDMVAVYRHLIDSMKPQDIAFAGDSAGAALSMLTMQRLARGGLPQPACAVLLSPDADLSVSQKWEAKLSERDCFQGSCAPEDEVRKRLVGEAAPAIGSADPKSPDVSPLYGVFDGLAPCYLLAGGAELLKHVAAECAERARKANVETKFELAPNMCHIYPVFHASYPEAHEALGRIADYIASH